VLWPVCCGRVIARELLATIALIPTFIVLGIACGIFVGGGMLRRQKRGRPETWLYRQLQWTLSTRWPLLAGWLGGNHLIARSGLWSGRRNRPGKLQ